MQRATARTCCEHYGVNCHQPRQCPQREPLPWLTPRRFWIGYVAFLACALLAVHIFAR